MILLPKGPSRKKEKSAKRRDHVRVVAEVRKLVWNRSGGRCDLCGLYMAGEDGEMHEDPPRSATRGRPPSDRFSTRQCCRAHRACHAKQTLNVESIEFDDPVLRFDGPYIVCEKESRYVVFAQDSSR